MPQLEDEAGPWPGTGRDIRASQPLDGEILVDARTLLALARRLELPASGVWQPPPEAVAPVVPPGPPPMAPEMPLPPVASLPEPFAAPVAPFRGDLVSLSPPPLLDPVPAVISRPASRDDTAETEHRWSGLGTVALLAGAMAACISLIVVSGRPPKPAPAAQRIEVPVIWAAATATAEGSATATATAEAPRLQSGPSTISRQDRDALTLAQKLIEDGDVVTARTVLLRAATEGLPEARVLLAETYDPNVLAAWGMTGIDPDVLKARELYFSALALGQERARRRLEMLD